jgi:hypothetical protein
MCLCPVSSRLPSIAPSPAAFYPFHMFLASKPRCCSPVGYHYLQMLHVLLAVGQEVELSLTGALEGLDQEVCTLDIVEDVHDR